MNRSLSVLPTRIREYKQKTQSHSPKKRSPQSARMEYWCGDNGDSDFSRLRLHWGGVELHRQTDIGDWPS